MENLKNLFALLILAMAISFTACNPEPATIGISGTVTDGTNPLKDVAVTDGTSEVKTGADGTYSITAAKDGKLTFSLKGYTSKTMDVNSQSTIDVTLTIDPWVESFAGNNNKVMDPQFGANTLVPSTILTATSSTDNWFTTANYKGAVAATTGPAWYALNNWSFTSRIIAGNMSSAAINTTGKPVKTINDAWMQAQGTNINWVKDTVYVLDGFVFVGNGQTLNIAAGTIIQGKPGNNANASALIVARGAKIEANGTSSEPIIFTYEGDNGNTPATERGKWGGLILLGKAGLNSSPGETQIEGIPTSETRGLYGGSDDADNSGTLRYVSIRHGGTNIGNDNEINGLTLGGVGSGTTIEYVEIVANKDDGIEWFGGTVNAKYLLSTYCADDALDYDEGYRGKNQFVIIYQDTDATAADRGGEHDGGTNPETGTPYATPRFWNVTSVGNTSSKAITFRDNAGGQYHNSIFVNFGKGIDIENLEQEQDSYKQFQDGELKIANCIFHNIGAGTEAVDLFTVTVPK